MGAQQSTPSDKELDIKESPEILFLFVYKNQPMLADRPISHAAAVSTVMLLFPNINIGENISFYTDELPCVAAHDQPNAVLIHVSRSISVLSLKKKVEQLNLTGWGEDLRYSGDDCWYFDLYHRGESLDERDTLEQAGLEDYSTLEIEGALRGYKPVIYLFSPEAIEATVKLSLVPQWSLSAIYPVVPIKKSTLGSLEEVQWTVRVNPDGTLLENTTGLEVTYLFWEAKTKNVPPSPPASPLHVARPREIFDPSHPVLNAENSVVIPVAIITPYLDRELRELGLHTEARTSFISFWLPAMLKHNYVALRFLPQDVYERAAPLEVTPRPDVVTRVYMIFQGVAEEDLGLWNAARKRGIEAPGIWRPIVGVDKSCAEDKGLFIVLEWGGMELPSHDNGHGSNDK